MADELRQASYADRAWKGQATIAHNASVARDTYRIGFRCPEIARQIVPGQFLMLRLPGTNDPLLGRPLAMYDTTRNGDGSPVGLEVVYLTVGKMTHRLATLKAGDPLEVWGPLGNGFPLYRAKHLVLVAGGIGQTPFLSLAKELMGAQRYGDPPRVIERPSKITLCYGARNEGYLAGVDDFRQLGIDVQISTDDGSAGHHGLVTNLLRSTLDASPFGSSPELCRIVSCGPEPMLEAVSKIAAERKVACDVSLETPMACGIGICFSCVAKIRDKSGEWDYRRTCVEGPVFPAENVEFH
jgi:dihydroorotate dehydrogenase electron transfer subunit